MKMRKKELQASLEECLVRHRVPGASLAVLCGGELTAAAAGLTNVTTGVEVTSETVMHIGSITKVFTATLVMQLVDDGAIDLDERVVRYLPDLRLKSCEALDQITVKMLLNHTSGIDGEMLPDFGHDEETVDKAIARFADLGQTHSPGVEFSYCNAATVIAGYLAQRLAGRSWYRLVRERVFEPLRMEHAATLPEEALLHRASVGHYRDPASGRKLMRTSCAFLPLSFGPAGTSLMMSARDLIAFAGAHMTLGVGSGGARILSERSARTMQQLTVDNRGKGYTYADGIGLGWMLFENGLLYHPGGGPGIVSALYAFPEQEFAAAILTNAAHGQNLINEFMRPLLEEVGAEKLLRLAKVNVPSEQVTVDFDKYIGVYEDVMDRYRVSRTSQGLALSRKAKWACYENISTDETPPARLTPLGDENFLLGADGADDIGSSDAFRIFTFRNPESDGHMRHLGNRNRLRRYTRMS